MSTARRRLVVVGNGMAGARAVEEILARGGGEQFAITMFGDEPYGNYNRIMLSHVLSGEEAHDGISELFERVRRERHRPADALVWVICIVLLRQGRLPGSTAMPRRTTS